MGKGNWLPASPNEDREYLVFYVEYPGSLEDDFHEEHPNWWDNLKAEILEGLPPSFTEATGWEIHNGPRREIVGERWNHTSCIAYNGHCLVLFDTSGEPWHQGIGFVYREAINPALAHGSMVSACEKLAQHLHYNLGYDLSARSCAWTSRPYIPNEPKAKKQPAGSQG